MRDCPYAGLMPFTEEQADFFFGREAEREIITANLMASRLTLLYGPSELAPGISPLPSDCLPSRYGVPLS